jgi:hypothetical protein
MSATLTYFLKKSIFFSAAPVAGFWSLLCNGTGLADATKAGTSVVRLPSSLHHSPNPLRTAGFPVCSMANFTRNELSNLGQFGFHAESFWAAVVIF